MTYVCLVLSIGLLVDFNIHILLRYYESKEANREAKVKDTLQTMGSSVFVGALSTCLAVIPLALSTSGIFSTVFVSFMAMVTLGIGHGVILLPVVLSICGPQGYVDNCNPSVVFKDNLDENSEEDDMSKASEGAAVTSFVTENDEEGKDDEENSAQTVEQSVQLDKSSVVSDASITQDDEENGTPLDGDSRQTKESVVPESIASANNDEDVPECEEKTCTVME